MATGRNLKKGSPFKVKFKKNSFDSFLSLLKKKYKHFPKKGNDPCKAFYLQPPIPIAIFTGILISGGSMRACSNLFFIFFRYFIYPG